jgi:hypothetical protein
LEKTNGEEEAVVVDQGLWKRPMVRKKLWWYKAFGKKDV